MDKLSDVLILVSFLIEVGVLVYLERRIWNTLFTPLVFLLLPYTLILLITIAVSGNLGFVEFYYPSILFWSVGSILFFIPSLIWGCFFNRRFGLPEYLRYNEFEFPPVVMWIIRIVALLFIYRFWSVLGSSQGAIGSDEFGDDFAGGGLFGHLREFSIALLMLLVYRVDKKHRSYFIYIIIFFLVGLLYQVKGWIIIPIVAGILARLITGRLKLKIGLLLRVVLFGFLLFQVSYIMSFTIGGDGSEITWSMMEWIAGHFFHYLTSGTFGFSMDVQRGFPDVREFEVLITPFYNIYATITGTELIKAVNPVYHFPGLSFTNVRTFFGTIYINGPVWSGIGYTLFLSFWIYGSMVLALVSRHLMFLMCFLLSCALLAMGWFDFYFCYLSVIEIPAYFFLIFLLMKCKFAPEVKC